MPQFTFAEKEITGNTGVYIVDFIALDNNIVLIDRNGNRYFYTNDMTFIEKKSDNRVSKVKEILKLSNSLILVTSERYGDWKLYDKNFEYLRKNPGSGFSEYNSVYHIIELPNNDIALAYVNGVKDSGSIKVYNESLTYEKRSISVIANYLFKFSDNKYIASYDNGYTINILDEYLNIILSPKIHPQIYSKYEYNIDQMFPIGEKKIFMACRDHTNYNYWVMILDEYGNILEEREESGYPRYNTGGCKLLPNGNVACYGDYSNSRVVIFISSLGEKLYRYSRNCNDNHRGFKHSLKIDNNTILFCGWDGSWVYFKNNGSYINSGNITQRGDVNSIGFTSEGNILTIMSYSDYAWILSYMPNLFKFLSLKINDKIYQGDKGWIKLNNKIYEIDSIYTKINGILKEV